MRALNDLIVTLQKRVNRRMMPKPQVMLGLALGHSLGWSPSGIIMTIKPVGLRRGALFFALL